MLSDSEKQMLLQIARQSIEAVVNKRTVPRIVVSSPALCEPRGAFVTLLQHHELRGCIGYVDPINPLWNAVQEIAGKAATEDPRFCAVEPEEITSLEIEISVLSSLRQIHSAADIAIGTHGVVVESDHHRGLLLPQVAVSAGWDRETFLEQTFRKSGLPSQLRHHANTRMFTFTAEVFDEAAVSHV